MATFRVEKHVRIQTWRKEVIFVEAESVDSIKDNLEELLKEKEEVFQVEYDVIHDLNQDLTEEENGGDRVVEWLIDDILVQDLS